MKLEKAWGKKTRGGGRGGGELLAKKVRLSLDTSLIDRKRPCFFVALFFSLARTLSPCRHGRPTTGRCVSRYTQRTRLAESRVTESTGEGFRRARRLFFVFIRHRFILSNSSTSKEKKTGRNRRHRPRLPHDRRQEIHRAPRREEDGAKGGCSLCSPGRLADTVVRRGPDGRGPPFPADRARRRRRGALRFFLAGRGLGVRGPAQGEAGAAEPARRSRRRGFSPYAAGGAGIRPRPDAEGAAAAGAARRARSLSASFSFLPSSAAIETLEKCVEGVLESALFVAAVASAVAGRSYLKMNGPK